MCASVEVEICKFTRPSTESIVMFGHQNHVLCPRSLHRSDPLLGIDLARIKDAGPRSTIAPFPIKKSVRAKMNDDANFHLLPSHLLRAGRNFRKVLSSDLHGQRKSAKQKTAKERQVANALRYVHGRGPACSEKSGFGVIVGRPPCKCQRTSLSPLARIRLHSHV